MQDHDPAPKIAWDCKVHGLPYGEEKAGQPGRNILSNNDGDPLVNPNPESKSCHLTVANLRSPILKGARDAVSRTSWAYFIGGLVGSFLDFEFESSTSQFRLDLLSLRLQSPALERS